MTKLGKFNTFINIVFILLIIFELCNFSIEIIRSRQHYIYEASVYDCTDMSRDWEYIFEKGLGIETQVIYGNRINESGNFSAHCWLRLHTFYGVYEFESTSLRFENVSKEWNVGKIEEGWIE